MTNKPTVANIYKKSHLYKFKKMLALPEDEVEALTLKEFENTASTFFKEEYLRLRVGKNT